jgi:uncharacterized protein (TIGR03435 family)
MMDGAEVVSRRILGGLFCAALMCSGLAGAQIAAAASVAPRGFEVASIRPADRNDGRNWYGFRVLPSGRFTASCVTLQSLAWQAYPGDSRAARISGGPKWINDATFDVNAKLDEADLEGWDKLTEHDRLVRARVALRILLEQRFQLKIHTETHIEPVYALVQAKHGVKMKEVQLPEPETPEQQDARLNDRGPKGPPPGGFSMGGDHWIASAVPVPALLGQITYELKLDHLLLDETGLKGYYAFDMKMSRDKDGPTMEQQIEDQLGLKVESRKAPITEYVIDSTEKPSVDGAEAQ